MWRKIGRELWMGVGFLICMTVLTGLAYPLLVTLMGKGIFPRQASGSAVVRNGEVVGSALIGQQFVSSGYFWSRPSATAPMPYNAMASSGSNLGPSNPDLVEAVNQRTMALVAADPGNSAGPPVDLVTSSASGLDPDISPAAALYQVGRVARARGLSEQTVHDLVESRIEGRQFGILGEPRVNVLRLNLDLDALAGKADNQNSRNP
jgi:K+-transporting ATPase ATPase C chain